MPINLNKDQLSAVDYLRNHNWTGYLWLPPGFGKTYTSLAAWNEMGRPRALLLCPAKAKQQHLVESEKFFGEPVATVIEGTAEERHKLWQQDWLLIANYDILVKDWPYPGHKRWGCVIADELFMCKSPTSKRSRILRKLTADSRIGLSGTAVINELYDLWAQCDFIRPGILGKNWFEFRTKYCKVNPFLHNKIVGYYDEAFIRKTFESCYFYIDAKDIAEKLPEITTIVHYIELSPTERKLYDELKKNLTVELEGGRRLTVANALGLLLQLQQVISNPRALGIDTPCSKKRYAEELILADSQTPVLLFADFREAAINFAGEHSGSLIIGGQSKENLMQAVQEFNNGNTNLIVATKAGEVALNLQRARTVIHLTLPYTHAALTQRVARSWRKGQAFPVTQHIILAKNTVDEFVWSLINKKRKLSESFSDIKNLLQ